MSKSNRIRNRHKVLLNSEKEDPRRCPQTGRFAKEDGEEFGTVIHTLYLFYPALEKTGKLFLIGQDMKFFQKKVIKNG